MVYDIVNPSDPYTIECPDFAIATVAALLLGNGAYIFEPVGQSAEKVPFFMFRPGLDKFCQQRWGVGAGKLIEQICIGRREEIAAALDSVLLCQPHERANEVAILAGAPSERAHLLRDERHDARRSSMNDIGRRAWGMADSLRTAGAELARQKEATHG